MWLWIIAILAGLLLALRVIYRNVIAGVCRSTRRLDGKTAIVTGSSAGIGKEAARDLAQRGARVILACRNVQKAQRIADDIIATTGNKDVVVRKVDTSDLTSVRKFAKEIINSEKALHILVNNAGIVAPTSKRLTSDGLELTMATNHFGHFLMTNMLLDLLKASAPSRIVNVSSMGHGGCKEFDTDDLNYEKKPYYSFGEVYGQTKLCNILFTVELAKRLHGTGVTANCLHPGGVSTEIMRQANNEGVAANDQHPGGVVIMGKVGNEIAKLIFYVIMKTICKDEKLGAQTINYLAVSEEVENVSGEYFTDCKIGAPVTRAKDHRLAQKLWEESERLVKLTQDDKVEAKKDI